MKEETKEIINNAILKFIDFIIIAMPLAFLFNAPPWAWIGIGMIIAELWDIKRKVDK